MSKETKNMCTIGFAYRLSFKKQYNMYSFWIWRKKVNTTKVKLVKTYEQLICNLYITFKDYYAL